MVLGIFRRDEYEKYRQLVGKKLQTSTGLVLGTITRVKVDKKSGKIVSLVYRNDSGLEYEVKVDGNLTIQDNVVVIGDVETEVEAHNTLIQNIRSNVEKIKSRLTQLDDMYRKLIQLLLDGKIDNTTFNEVKTKLDSEREKLYKACEEAVKSIDEALREIERKSEELKKRQHELYAKKVLGNAGSEDEAEIKLIEHLLEKLRKARHELSMLRLEVVVECGRL